LKPFDVVNVKEIPDWKERRAATITGEVLFRELTNSEKKSGSAAD